MDEQIDFHEKEKLNLRLRTLKMIVELERSILSSDNMVNLFQRIISLPDGLNQILCDIHSLGNIEKLNEVLYLIYDSLIKYERTLNEEERLNIVKSIFNCVDVNYNDITTRNDILSLKFFIHTAKICALFPEEVRDMSNNIANLTLLRILLSAYIVDYSTDEIDLFSKKFTNNLFSYCLYVLCGSKSDFSNDPSIKVLIASYKSITDDQLNMELAEYFLNAVLIRLNENNYKEIVSLINYIPRRLRRNPNGVFAFVKIINKVLEYSEGFNTVKASIDEILSTILIVFCDNKVDDDEEVVNPKKLMRMDIGDSFVDMCRVFSIDPVEDFIKSKLDNYRFECLLMFLYLATYTDCVLQSHFDILISEVPINMNSLTSSMSLILHISIQFSNKFKNPKALKLLIKGLYTGSIISSKYIIDSISNFDFLFTELSSLFNPGKMSSLYTDTLVQFLRANFPQLKLNEIESGMPDGCVDPSKLNVKPADEVTFDLDIQPTNETILFCNTLSNAEEFPELLQVLPYSAAVISLKFAENLYQRFPSQLNNKTQNIALAAYGNALQFLDINNVYKLAQTLVMMPPKKAMLYLSVTLQRLPKSVVETILQKTRPFANDFPTLFGKMLSLVSCTHPDTVMTYLNSIIDCSISKKRYFTFFRSNLIDDQVLIVIFRAIGCCSGLIEESVFNGDFLDFSVSIFRKYLTYLNGKSKDFVESVLFAVLRLFRRANDIKAYFKDVTFKSWILDIIITSFLEVNKPQLSSTEYDSYSLASQFLDSLSYIFVSYTNFTVTDNVKNAIDLASVLVQISANNKKLYKAASDFYYSIFINMECIKIFTCYLLPLVHALLTHKEWKQICAIVHVCTKRTSSFVMKSVEDCNDALKNILTILSYVLPLIYTEIEQIASELIDTLLDYVTAIYEFVLPKSKHNSVGDQTSYFKKISLKLNTEAAFDLILNLLSHFKPNTGILVVHKISISKCVEQMIKLVGVEEASYDSEILKGISTALDDESNSNEVVEVLIHILGFLLSVRLTSIVNSLLQQEKLLSEKNFNRVITFASEIKNGPIHLLEEVGKSLVSNPNSNTIYYCTKILSLLKDNIKDVDDKTWAHLFTGIYSKSIKSKFLIYLFGETELKDTKEIAAYILNNRYKSIKTIVEVSKRVKLETSLLFELAITASDYSGSLLSLIIEEMKKSDLIPYDLITKFLECCDPKNYDSEKSQLFTLLLRKLPIEGYECLAIFLSKLEPKESESYWKQICKRSVSSIEFYLKPLAVLCERSQPFIKPFHMIIHVIACNGSEESKFIIESLAKSQGIEIKEDPLDTAVELICSSTLSPYFSSILSEFELLLEDKRYCETSIFVISKLSSKISTPEVKRAFSLCISSIDTLLVSNNVEVVQSLISNL